MLEVRVIKVQIARRRLKIVSRECFRECFRTINQSDSLADSPILSSSHLPIWQPFNEELRGIMGHITLKVYSHSGGDNWAKKTWKMT